MDEHTLFSKALGLANPWKVVDLKFSKDEGRLDLWIDFEKGAKFPCPDCSQGEAQPVHDTRDRTWRHLNFFQYETYLHARVPRVRCSECGVKQVSVPWSRPGSGFTLLFELLVLSLCREMSVAAVAQLTGTEANRIWRVLDHYVERARMGVDISGLRKLGMDEFSKRKGHVYMTSFSDLETSRVLFVAEGRRKGVVEDFIEDLEVRGVAPSKIKVICCDMWNPFLNGINKDLSQAKVVFDRFHVMKKINLAVETVRRQEQSNNAYLKKTRYIWLKNPKNLTPTQHAKLASLQNLDLKTARAYQLKLSLARFWTIKDPNLAERYLKRWYFWATHSRLGPIIKVAKTIKRYWDGVVAYHVYPVTNGVVEGLNSKIKTAMKRAYGFKDSRYLKTIVYLVVGKLKFDYPH